MVPFPVFRLMSGLHAGGVGCVCVACVVYMCSLKVMSVVPRAVACLRCLSCLWGWSVLRVERCLVRFCRSCCRVVLCHVLVREVILYAVGWCLCLEMTVWMPVLPLPRFQRVRGDVSVAAGQGPGVFLWSVWMLKMWFWGVCVVLDGRLSSRAG